MPKNKKIKQTGLSEKRVFLQIQEAENDIKERRVYKGDLKKLDGYKSF